ncbi:MAG: hypothetical protein OEZ06_03475 [Myxococcales bacterium]|nr:hypothetical protein [Myxococcales bacterium]
MTTRRPTLELVFAWLTASLGCTTSHSLDASPGSNVQARPHDGAATAAVSTPTSRADVITSTAESADPEAPVMALFVDHTVYLETADGAREAFHRFPDPWSAIGLSPSQQDGSIRREILHANRYLLVTYAAPGPYGTEGPLMRALLHLHGELLWEQISPYGGPLALDLSEAGLVYGEYRTTDLFQTTIVDPEDGSSHSLPNGWRKGGPWLDATHLAVFEHTPDAIHYGIYDAARRELAALTFEPLSGDEVPSPAVGRAGAWIYLTRTADGHQLAVESPETVQLHTIDAPDAEDRDLDLHVGPGAYTLLTLGGQPRAVLDLDSQRLTPVTGPSFTETVTILREGEYFVGVSTPVGTGRVWVLHAPSAVIEARPTPALPAHLQAQPDYCASQVALTRDGRIVTRLIDAHEDSHALYIEGHGDGGWQRLGLPVAQATHLRGRYAGDTWTVTADHLVGTYCRPVIETSKPAPEDALAGSSLQLLPRDRKPWYFSQADPTGGQHDFHLASDGSLAVVRSNHVDPGVFIDLLAETSRPMEPYDGGRVWLLSHLPSTAPLEFAGERP